MIGCDVNMHKVEDEKYRVQHNVLENEYSVVSSHVTPIIFQTDGGKSQTGVVEK